VTGKACGIAHDELRDVVDRLGQVHAAVALANRALDLGMTGVSDHHDLASLLAHLRHLDVHLGNAGARRVEHVETAFRRCFAHGPRDAVGAEDHGRSIGNLVERFDEYRTPGAQLGDDEAVVHQFVAYVDRRTEMRERLFYDRDRAIHTRAEAARIGKHDFHHAPPSGVSRGVARRSRNASRISAAAPTVIALSAKLNDG